MSSDGEVILQLSDVHFGAEPTAVGVADRDVVLQSLVESLEELDTDWKPSIVATTGDIGWAGKDTDYGVAAQWYSHLSASLGVPRAQFLFIPGNHDVDRGFARTLPRPASHAVADQIFENGIPEHWKKPFEAYAAFCETFGAKSFTFRDAPSYLMGKAIVRGVRFVGVNSCWFSQGNDDEHKLRLSLALMKLLEADGALIAAQQWSQRPITVALMHHPQTWLHREEYSHWDVHGQGAFLHLAARTHLILCGHTHEVPRGHGRIRGGGIELQGGASFANAGHPNTYQLVRFRRNHLEYRQFELKNRPTSRSWRSEDATPVRLSDTADADVEAELKDRISRNELRARIAAYAAKYIESKSRVVSQDQLPKLQPLLVEIRLNQRLRSDGREIEVTERISLDRAIADAPRLLVWGDLGTGKSTLVGMFSERVNRSEETTAILIPASQLDPVPSTGLELLHRASIFVHGALLFDRAAFDLREEILNAPDLTILIIDGLDEIDNRAARKVLGALEHLSETLPRLRVVATSRAVSHDYNLGRSWHNVTMASLQTEERKSLLLAVAIAAGLSSGEAEADAKAMLQRIDADEVLKEAAQSPLALRLLYRELRSSTAGGDRTLGEMLSRLLDERLSRWEEADEAKGRPTQAFCDALPGVQGRRAVALHAQRQGSLQIGWQ